MERQKLSQSYLRGLKNFDRKTTLWIIKNAKPQIWSIVLLALLNGLSAYAGVAMAQVARFIVDSAAYDKDVNKVIFYAILLIGITAAQIIISVSLRVTSFNVNAKMEIAIKSKLFDTMIRKDYAKITSYHTGELMNRITSDVLVITDAVVNIVPNVTFFVVKLTGILVVLFSIDWRFAIVFVIGAAIVMIFMLIFKGKLKFLHKRAQESDGKTRSFMQESLASLLVIKVFNKYNRISDEADKLQWNNFKIRRKRNYIGIGASLGFSIVFVAAYMYGLVWGSFMILSGAITYGILTEILSLVSQIQSPVQGLTSILPQYYQALASAERIIEIENFPEEHQLDENVQIDCKELYDNLDSVEFENITFSYGRDTVLENTSLSIKKGDFIVITGISGIGKSTLTKLLLDVFPVNEGEIYFKLKDGGKVIVDRNIRNMFAYVPQGNFLLSGTIRENISFVRPDATDDEIMEAAKTACADFIDELPDGLDTILGEKGMGLSEGQVQRVAIARAILAGAPMIILDEATSALDEATEIRLLENIENFKNKTCILISHKKAANKVCNKEVRIEDKKIIVKEI
ncbi:MAG: ABC transporter ATP-binding protein/permease [Ruminococcus sp.]|nr:ABC transporter ATP-binding protein/permease [Ruminococcus sp.]